MRIHIVGLATLILSNAPALTARTAEQEDEVANVTVRVPDEVIVRQVERFGINFWGCGEMWNENIPLLKKRVMENFEGGMYRRCEMGEQADENGLFAQRSVDEDELERLRSIYEGGTATILSGQDKWANRQINRIEPRRVDDREAICFRLDRPFRPHPKMNGLLLESLHTDNGFFASLDDPKRCSPENELVTGDTHPEAFGSAALKLNASESTAFVRSSTHSQKGGPLAGTWRVRFWAKAASGSPVLAIRPVQDGRSDVAFGSPKEITPPDKWQSYDEGIVVDRVPNESGLVLAIQFDVNAGGAFMSIFSFANTSTRPRGIHCPEH
jgi:hypothetical protein